MSETLRAMPTVGDISNSDRTQKSIEDMSSEEIDTNFSGIIKTTFGTFGSQVMKVYEGIQDLPVMSGGPTWTGSGKTQDADDGDTGGGGSDD
jgi:hypothetical protein